MAEYKKTPKNEVSKLPSALHYSKCQNYFQGNQEYPEIANTSKNGE